MDLGGSNGFVASNGLEDLENASLPIFNTARVQLQFSVAADFVAAQVANNVLIVALSTGRILRIDLDSPADIDDIDLPKKPSEIGVVRHLFLDPTASHLIITTTLGENYYLHTQSRQPRALSRLKGVPITDIAWNPSSPTASTREILVGAADGNIYETFIEPSSEFYRREEKYLKVVYKVPDGEITGLQVSSISGTPDSRRVLVATHGRLYHFAGRIGRHGNEGAGSIFTRLFETETATVHEAPSISSNAPSAMVITPDPSDVTSDAISTTERAFAWLMSQGVFYGKLLQSATGSNSGSQIFSEGLILPRSQLPASGTAGGRKKATHDPIQSIVLTQWHILCLVDGRVIGINRLNQEIVYDQLILEQGQQALGLVADPKKNTFWLFTNSEIFEIEVNDEDRDVWKILLAERKFDAALQFAKTFSQKDAVATASGDGLVSKGKYQDAALVYGRSSKSFEQVALTFIDHGEQDALRKYLLTKLSLLKRSSIMQRTMLSSWLIELYMSKLNNLDDTITTKAELAENINTSQTEDLLSSTQAEFHDFVTKYKSDLDRKTTYEVISSHGRETELLYYANVINDYGYVLNYWVQRERWPEALAILKKQTDPEVFYKYSSVLVLHVPSELVDIWMRQSNLDPRSLIPALLDYNKASQVPLNQNQAVRYLLFAVNQLQSTDAAIHNTLISIYASSPTSDESSLLTYLESQSHAQQQFYDADFALRLCIQHKRIQSCVHIYSSMGQYLQAVELALKYEEVELASIIADRPESDAPLRKKLWLAVAKKVVSQSEGIKTAIEFLRRCELLRIEDLIPFFPDFVVIDDFKEEICTALEEYSRHIDALNSEMDESAQTAAHIKSDIAALDHRYAIVEPGEGCYICQYPLLSRQFFVFPCQHAFHSDCLAKRLVEQSGMGKGRRIRELQNEVSRGLTTGAKREEQIKELDSLVGGACILCSDLAVKLIDEPFVTPADNTNDWAL